ncbi:hypothetical protein DFJ77DRAFT_462194 [Powellomyces hirtus]|nr:hypothetical protein DFJ77DRAFT_462194 [Powellomyces hirtus]
MDVWKSAAAGGGGGGGGKTGGSATHTPEVTKAAAAAAAAAPRAGASPSRSSPGEDAGKLHAHNSSSSTGRVAVDGFWPIRKPGAGAAAAAALVADLPPVPISPPRQDTTEPLETPETPAAAEGDFNSASCKRSVRSQEADAETVNARNDGTTEDADDVNGTATTSSASLSDAPQPVTIIDSPPGDPMCAPAPPDTLSETTNEPNQMDEGLSDDTLGEDDDGDDGDTPLTSRVPNSTKIAMRRVWSPSRLQVPQFSAGSIFDDPDWMQAFMPTQLSSPPPAPSTDPTDSLRRLAPMPSAPPPQPPPQPQPQPQAQPQPQPQAPSKSQPQPRSHPSLPAQPDRPPRGGDTRQAGPAHATPRRRDSLGQTFESDTASLVSLADSLDEGFADDPAYYVQPSAHTATTTTTHLAREASLGSLVDDIMGRGSERRRKCAGKNVRFGRAWNGELESRKLLFTVPEGCKTDHEGRIGVLYLQLNSLENVQLQRTRATEVTINIRQQKAERMYEWEVTRVLPVGKTQIDLDFDCEIPLLPTHPISLVFYFKSVGEDRAPSPPYVFPLPSPTTTTTPSGPPGGAAQASHPLRPAHQRKNSLISFFRSKKSDENNSSSSSSSVSASLPGSKRNSFAATGEAGLAAAAAVCPRLVVAESDPHTPESWAQLLCDATGKLADHVFVARLLEWKNALVHGAAVASVACRIGFLPFMDDRIHRTFWPKRVQDYAMGVRVAEWNEALSMEGYLWQLGGDVRTTFQRRYYKLHGSSLSVYGASPDPRVTDVPWEEYDFDPDTQLPLPLEQSHDAHKIVTIELAHLESWCSYEKPRVRSGSVVIPGSTTTTTTSDSDASAASSSSSSLASSSSSSCNERTTLPTPSAAFVLLFKDGREIILGVDPAEVVRYQVESDRFSAAGETSESTSSLGTHASKLQLTLMQWRPLDIADMWKQAFNEVLNGVKYDVPVWAEPLREWRAAGGQVDEGRGNSV